MNLLRNKWVQRRTDIDLHGNHSGHYNTKLKTFTNIWPSNISILSLSLRRVFQKRVVRTKLDIYVLTSNVNNTIPT